MGGCEFVGIIWVFATLAAAMVYPSLGPGGWIIIGTLMTLIGLWLGRRAMIGG